MTTAASAIPAPPSPRLLSIDFLRGLVMVIMALDHVRDFMHFDIPFFNPLDETKTSIGLYLTRWVTHFCAPTFVMLAGASIYLVSTRRSREDLRRFLLTRGLWLILIDLTLMSFIFSFTPHFVFFGVIAAIGMSMILLSLLLSLPVGAVFSIGLFIILFHNLTDGIQLQPGTPLQLLWGLLRSTAGMQLGSMTIFAGYPILPWFGVMAAGYGLGSLFRHGYDAAKRKHVLRYVGAAAILLFLVLRYFNIYGNPTPWKPGATTTQSVMSFFNVLKYPPSLLFLLITLGPVLIFLSFLDNARIRPGHPLISIGRVPFFYYILHMHAIHLIAVLVGVIMGFPLAQMLTHNFSLDAAKLRGQYGVSLAWVYAIWLLLVLGLYPLCRRYAAYKQQHQDKRWLSYL
ncbi:DUF1624 domain-containing protein [Chitinophaga agrisoli]|uniref:DUF1624 domain-containing protein n=1 Tax=Chitinophaga agrisoli TaxID=2607653 RepID=A0A5B2VHC4_9BACT|nr:heparan-alpha-glucosaminide N-acetyltransferase domain-containing protein [Chitinophaga agrisoli]KAA2238521.1 DUF1624 domain-containing protein [Chitinophaga agrisoli]